MKSKTLSSSERRSSPRLLQKQRVLISDPCDALDDPFPAWIMDRSRGGICLSIGGQDIEEGTVLSVTGQGIFEVRVTNRRPSGHGFEIGCQFVD